jgi:hypothetical protein
MKIINLLLVFSLSFSAFAAEIPQPPLLGQAEFKWFFFSVYDVKLWAPDAKKLYSNVLLLEIKYKQKFKGIDIAKQSEKELLHAGIEMAVVDKWRSILLEIFPDINAGDRILASFHPTEGITFYLNSNKVLGHIADLSFSKNFLDIWLGEKTSEPELRDKLLGLKL